MNIENYQDNLLINKCLIREPRTRTLRYNIDVR